MLRLARLQVTVEAVSKLGTVADAYPKNRKLLGTGTRMRLADRTARKLDSRAAKGSCEGSPACHRGPAQEIQVGSFSRGICVDRAHRPCPPWPLSATVHRSSAPSWELSVPATPFRLRALLVIACDELAWHGQIAIESGVQESLDLALALT